MRIIAGEFRSRRLKTPGDSLRPTSDRLRETLFDVLGDSVSGSVWLDCYAGTGAVGLEALSRGAAQAIFIEQAHGSLRILDDNIASLGVDDRSRVLNGTVEHGLRRLAREGLCPETISDACRRSRNMPGFIFIDPPYQGIGEYQRTLGLLESLPLVDVQTLVIAEHDRRLPTPDPQPSTTNLRAKLCRVRLLEQGDSALSFYKLE